VTRSERGQLLRDRLQISLRPENKQRDEFQKAESGLIHRSGQASVPHRPLCPVLSSDRNWTASCHPVRVMDWDVQSIEGYGLDGRQSTGPSSAMKCIRLELQLVLHHSIYHLRSKLEHNYAFSTATPVSYRPRALSISSSSSHGVYYISGVLHKDCSRLQSTTDRPRPQSSRTGWLLSCVMHGLD
jgi:hypothetical protein